MRQSCRPFSVALALILYACVIARAASTTRLENWRDAARGRDVPAKLYLPQPFDKPAPVVILSPGLGGSRDGYTGLATAWADAGYAVVVLTHVGSDTDVFRPGGKITMQSAMTGKELVARTKDVSFAVDELARWNDKAGDALAGKFDLSKLAMAGHSYGAVTTQAMMGQTYAGQSFADDRFRCGVMMSPSPPRQGDAAESFNKVDRPLLHLTGTLDDSPLGDMPAAKRRVPFDLIKASPQYLVTFTDGDHAIFGGRQRVRPEKEKLDAAFRPVIDEVTTKFLNAHLRDDKAAGAWLRKDLKAAIGALGTLETK